MTFEVEFIAKPLTTQQIQDMVDAARCTSKLRVNDLGVCVQLVCPWQAGIEFYYSRRDGRWSKGGRPIADEAMPYVLAAWRDNTYASPEWLFKLAADARKREVHQ